MLAAGFSIENDSSYLVLPLPPAQQAGVHAVPSILKGSDCTIDTYSDRITRLRSGTAVARVILLPDLMLRKQREPFVGAALPLSPTDRPTLALTMGGRNVTGVLDSGADVTVIAKKDWPPAWPTEPAAAVAGVGGKAAAQRSCQPICFQSPTGLTITLYPLVMDLPVSLWGRDLLSAADTSLHTNLC